ncbi:unnamed protein product [Rotaria sordida]|uniref:G-protein coupled receptors family 1 profile domain-containing protein n=1 Tax=Rotaria sordida TaxID=392033 RepID=A0A819AR80_9BILA|nr:unnamed protein product [Rotaria sordida]CAF1112883.1 unnamed protein product [Rotaria sordida]CAF3789376.1 unnamed protein product [Rotaria sordida]CAF3836440.1 unnamed protein product [Rotaria sordida]
MTSIEMLVWITEQISIGGYLILLISGIIGSCANIYIFSRKRLQRSPCFHYVFIASVFDFFNISFSVTTRLMADGFQFDPFTVSSIGCRIRTYIAFVVSFCPMGCRCLAIIDRYLCTSQSIFLRNLSSVKIADRLLFINCSLWFLIGIPMLIVFDSIHVNSNQVTCNTLNKEFTNYFSFFVNPVLYFFIPIIIIIIFSTLTYRNIRFVNRIHNVKMKQLAFMIIIETSIFVISSIPHGTRFIYILLTNSIEKNVYRKAQENLFYQISRITFFFNSAFSFYIYFLLSSEVRSIIKSIFIKRHHRIVPIALNMRRPINS